MKILITESQLRLIRNSLLNENYRGNHKAPDKDSGSPLYNLYPAYPQDIYSSDAIKIYGDNSPHYSDSISLNIIKELRGYPNAPVKIYRAVPDMNKSIDKKIKKLGDILYYYDKHNQLPIKNTLLKNFWPADDIETLIKIRSEIRKLQDSKTEPIKINPGDWVTLNKDYAKHHARRFEDGYKILTKTVPAKHLFSEGSSIHEWGYDPE